MKDYIEERAIEIANYIIESNATVRQAVYKVDSKGVITALTDPAYNAAGVKFSPDGKYFVASYSNVTTEFRDVLNTPPFIQETAATATAQIINNLFI